MVSQRLALVVYLLTGALAAVTSWLFAPFTADDAYIVARYAVNVRDAGEWVFNQGEYVSALTSPLHGVLLIGLSLVAADPLPGYKAVAAAAVAAASLFLLVRYGVTRREALPLAAVIATPSLVMWTFAGLETPLLAAVVTCMSAMYAIREDDSRSVLLLGLLAGTAVVTRYDAVLFAGPVLLAALMRSTSWRKRIVATGAAAVLPAAWFLYAWSTFDSVLPTSFYVKTPTAARDVLVTNLRYIAEHMVITGLAIMAAYAAVQLLSGERPAQAVLGEMRRRWGLYLGVLAVVAYGATMATVHMMFAFRAFIPYVGAAALAVAHVARTADGGSPQAASAARSPIVAAAAALMILAIHGVHADALNRRSLQGLGTFGEYDRQGAAGYAADYVPAMQRNAADIKAHWAKMNHNRAPRIWTFAAGALPYSYREAYIFEQLVSFRLHCPPGAADRPDARLWRAHADYIHAFTRHGSVPRLLAPLRNRQVTLISEQRLRFNGQDEKLLVYFNPDPQPNVVPSRISDPCTGAGAAPGARDVP